MVAQGNGAKEALTFVISVAAELAGMHPQALRQYDRLGFVILAGAKGRGRRYSKRDIQRLHDVQRMSQEEGINFAGIQGILELERSVERLEEESLALKERLAELMQWRDRVFAATPSGEVLPMRRGERSWAPKRSSSGGEELALWGPFHPPFYFRPEQRVRAVAEAGPAGVRVIEGNVAVIGQPLTLVDQLLAVVLSDPRGGGPIGLYSSQGGDSAHIRMGDSAQMGIGSAR